MSPTSATGKTVLIDTHILLWSMLEPDRLSPNARPVIQDTRNTILVSAAVAWEISIKVKSGKFSPASIIEKLGNFLEQTGFHELTITVEHATRAGSLALHHSDPFDRLLVAQSLSLNIPIISADAFLDKYEVDRLW